MAAAPCDPLRLDTETMTMDENTFARYAEHLEREDFESDLYRICCSIRWVARGEGYSLVLQTIHRFSQS